MKCQYSLKLNRSYFNLLTHLQVLYLLPVGYRIDRYPLSSLFYNISTTYYLVDKTTYLSFSFFLSFFSWDCKQYGHKSGDRECRYSIESSGLETSSSQSKKHINRVSGKVSFTMEDKRDERDNRDEGAYSGSEAGGKRQHHNADNKSGLEATIMEMLSNYEPTSSQRKPFWCRICRFQGKSIDDYEKHIKCDFHQKAQRVERELSSCKICNKEFTSPDQLREHKEGKAHKEKMASMSCYKKHKLRL